MRTAIKIILLIASLILAMGAIGAKEKEAGDRCIILAVFFNSAMMLLFIVEMIFGIV